VQLAEMDDFLLLRRTKAFHTYVPLVVTASASEKDSARRVLTKGAFDLITTPLEHEQTVGTIRLALCQSKLMSLITRKEETLEKYRQHMTDYPCDRNKMAESFQRAIAAFEKTISSIERIMLRMEESMVCFFRLRDESGVLHQKTSVGTLDRAVKVNPTAFRTDTQTDSMERNCQGFS
jgi:response regulator RpfG family c-di-GMP phosphodiesterase